MTTEQSLKNCLNRIQHCKRVAYRNAAINAKLRVGSSCFYKEALEVIKYYKSVNSHRVDTIQGYCNLMGYSTY